MITTDRNQFLGTHVTPEVKEGLRKAANKEGISVSALVFRLLKEKLDALREIGVETK